METFGSYRLLRLLGRGGMGVVYIARSRHPNHPVVALKKIRDDAARVPSFRERFQHECDLALRLDHPRIAEVVDAGRIDGTPYIASELILGKDLGAVSKRLASLGREASCQIAIRIVIDVLAGLDYVHGVQDSSGRPMRLVHRDVTPTNIIVGYDGASRLVDFGLAKSWLSEQLQITESGVILGTPKFVAPEIARGASAGPRSDLYGLGAVIYRLLTGRSPHEGTVMEVLEALLTKTPIHLQALRADLPDWFAKFVHSLLASKPDDRPQSAREAGLMLVEASRRHDALLPRTAIGRWLQDLFDDDCLRQTEDYCRDRALELHLPTDVDMTEPPGKGKLPSPRVLPVIMGSPAATPVASEDLRTMDGPLAVEMPDEHQRAVGTTRTLERPASTPADRSRFPVAGATTPIRPADATLPLSTAKSTVPCRVRRLTVAAAVTVSCGLTGFFFGWAVGASPMATADPPPPIVRLLLDRVLCTDCTPIDRQTSTELVPSNEEGRQQ